MTTVRDIVERAYRKIGVVANDEDMGADEASSGLDEYNIMVSAWKLSGVDTLHADLALSDTFPLADEYREGTIYMLASRLAPNWSAPANFDADDFFRKIQAAYMTISEVSLDGNLSRMPSQISSVYWSS